MAAGRRRAPCTERSCHQKSGDGRDAQPEKQERPGDLIHADGPGVAFLVNRSSERRAAQAIVMATRLGRR